MPTWFAGAYVLGVALSPIGRLAYGLSQAIVWPLLREAWTPAIRFLAERPERSAGLTLGDPARMGSGQFHDVDRRLREYIKAFDPGARRTIHRLKMLCSLSCNALAATLVFIAIDALAGRRHRAQGLRPCDGADRGRVSGASSPADPAVAVAAPVHRARPAEPAQSGAA